MKRHLPVLPRQGPDDDPSRPGWHWVVIGAGFVFTLWMPLVMVAQWLARMIGRTGTGPSAGESRLALVLLLLALALASLAAGSLVGRFGRGARARHVVLGALAGVAAAWVLALFAGALTPFPVAAASLAVLSVTSAPVAWLAFKLVSTRARRLPPGSGAAAGVDRPDTRH